MTPSVEKAPLRLLFLCAILGGHVAAFVAPMTSATTATGHYRQPAIPLNQKTVAIHSPRVDTSCRMLSLTELSEAQLSIPQEVWGLASVLALASFSLQIVQQGNVAIVERLGKFQTCLEPGLHVTIPLVDRVATEITRREQGLDIPPQRCITQDNAPLKADAVVYWKVVDPQKAFYSVVDLEVAIQNLVLTQLRSEIGKLTLDATFSAREQINAVLLQDLDIATEPWGVKITRVELQEIVPNKEIMAAMEMQMAAERTKRAVVIKSEGERARAVNQAEGDAQSMIIDAKAEAESLRLKAQAEAIKLQLEAEGAAKSLEALMNTVQSADEAVKFQLAREYIEAQRALATSQNAKVILSSDSNTDPLVKALAMYESPSLTE